MIGKILAHYEIIEKIGAGGMGEVWKARDTSLNREVAIKTLPEAFSENADRLARFEQEAKLLGGLDHPGLATVYGLHEEDGLHFLALELVPGTDLSRQLTDGPLPLQDALEIGVQLADALQAAHDHGVVHRDLKPANIMVTPEGKVKILDFGLARSMVSDPGSSSELLSQSPTMAVAATRAGAILGTAAYMSPEQARGKPVDHRTDLWAFGCVLYEMLTGHIPYAGETVSDAVAKILERDPEWDRLPEDTPAGIRKLLRRCLTKDAHKRQQSAGDARLEIEDVLSGESEESPTPAVPLSRSRVTMLALLAIPIVALGAWVLKPSPGHAPSRPLHAEIPLPEGRNAYSVGHAVAVSPDGDRIAFIGANHDDPSVGIYLQDLDEDHAVLIPGTDSNEFSWKTDIFFSPDGRWLGYHEAVHGLRKVEIGSGRPVTICAGAFLGGSSWGPDGTIITSRAEGDGLFRVSAAGGEPDTLTRPTGNESVHSLPRHLPGGRYVLFTARAMDTRDWGWASVHVLDLETGERRRILENAGDARYVATGHLLFARGTQVLAVPFDLDRLQTTGEPVPVLSGVRRPIRTNNTVIETGAAQFATSRTGLLAYVTGGEHPGWRNRAVWVSRDGSEEPLPLREGVWTTMRLDRTGRRILLYELLRGIWVLDLERSSLRQQVIEATHPSWSVWMPGTDRFSFSAGVGGKIGLFAKTLNTGASEMERIPIPGYAIAAAWRPEGTDLLLYDYGDDGLSDYHGRLASYSDEGELREIAPRDVKNADFSPDGSCVVYVSNEGGDDFHVFARTFSGEEPSVQISNGIGSNPCWSSDGSEIFYMAWNDSVATMYAVTVKMESGRLVPGTPEELFEGPYLMPEPNRSFDVAPDGRFLMLRFIRDHPDLEDWNNGATRIRIVQNWFDELKEMVGEAE